MKDHTCDGMPVAQMTTEHIKSCLSEGIVINNSDGRSIKEAERCVYERLMLELEIRQKGLRS